jgi:hypothetical protein
VLQFLVRGFASTNSNSDGQLVHTLDWRAQPDHSGLECTVLYLNSEPFLEAHHAVCASACVWAYVQQW